VTGSTALVRRLDGMHDPVELHAALAADGTVPMLFRRTAGRAIIIVDAALQIEAKGLRANIRALSEGGRILLSLLALRLDAFVTARHGAELTLAFPRCTANDEEVRLAHPTPFDVLRTVQEVAAAGPREALMPLLAGVIGFDHIDMLEDLPPAAAGSAPDIAMTLAETIIVVEQGGAARIVAMAVTADEAAAHRQQSLAAERIAVLDARIAAARCPALTAAPSARSAIDMEDSQFAGAVMRLKEDVAAGDIFQCVPSRTMRVACDDAVAGFRRLVAADPSTYQFCAPYDGGLLFGASPETAVSVRSEEGRIIVSVSPIAGTRARGATPDQDDRMEADLRIDGKENAEHFMLVDLARNDVARVSKAGTRRVTRLLNVERYARVMHLVSTVEGEMDDGRDAVDALKACLNVGTLSGAPKLKAIELIRAVETSPRGAYGGAIGVIAGDGTLDSAVVIRSAFVKDGVAIVRAGAGVVADSDPLAEAAETRAKAGAVLAALGVTA
jgi:anthranilate synthase component 1